MVTIVGKPNNCQVVTVISQPAAIEGPIANPLSRPHNTVAENSSVAAMANASGPSTAPDGSFESTMDGNQFWLTVNAMLPRPLIGSLPNPNNMSEKRCRSPRNASIDVGSHPKKIAKLFIPNK